MVGERAALARGDARVGAGWAEPAISIIGCDYCTITVEPDRADQPGTTAGATGRIAIAECYSSKITVRRQQ